MKQEQLSRVMRCFREQQYDAAFDLCAEAIRADSSDWNALYLAGVTFRHRRDFASAVAYYRRALDIAPEFTEVWHALGIALQMLRQFPDAICAFQTAIRIEPTHYASHNSLGITFKLVGDRVSAMRAYEDALQVCANRAFQTVREEHPEFVREEERGGARRSASRGLGPPLQGGDTADSRHRFQLLQHTKKHGDLRH